MAASNQQETRGYRSFLRPGQVIERQAPPPAMVALAELKPERKRELWQWMQANDPVTADYLANLKTNPDVVALEAAFGSVRPAVTLNYIQKAIG